VAKTLLASWPALHLPVPTASVTTAPGAGKCIISSEIETTDMRVMIDLFTRSTRDTRRDRFRHALSVFSQRYLEEILSGSRLAVAARGTCHEEGREKVFGLASAAPIRFGIAERIAPGAAARSEDGMISVSIPLTDLAAEPDARS
jgi:hypothetical protein